MLRARTLVENFQEREEFTKRQRTQKDAYRRQKLAAGEEKAGLCRASLNLWEQVFAYITNPDTTAFNKPSTMTWEDFFKQALVQPANLEFPAWSFDCNMPYSECLMRVTAEVTRLRKELETFQRSTAFISKRIQETEAAKEKREAKEKEAVEKVLSVGLEEFEDDKRILDFCIFCYHHAC